MTGNTIGATPEERERLLPLARLIAGNVMAHEAGDDAHPEDAHFALRIMDGLHDEIPQVQGALDALTVVMERREEYDDGLSLISDRAKLREALEKCQARNRAYLQARSKKPLRYRANTIKGQSNG